jgi:hypothetical protein
MLHLILLDVSQKEERGGCRQTAKDRKLIALWQSHGKAYAGCVGLPSSISCQQARLRGLEQRSRINTSVRAKEERETRMTLCREISHLTHSPRCDRFSLPIHVYHVWTFPQCSKVPSLTYLIGADVGLRWNVPSPGVLI